MEKRIRKPITRKFLIYMVLLIVSSNCLLFAITFSVYRNHLEKQATEYSVSLLKRNLESVNRYLVGIDDIAYSLIYNPDLIELIKRRENTAADTDLLNSIFSIFYQSRSDLKLTIYKEADPDKMYSIYSGTGQEIKEDFHLSEWYRKLESSGENRIMVSNQIAAYSDREGMEYVHVMVYKIRDQYSSDCVGYLRVDIDLASLKEYFIGDYENIDGISIYDTEGRLMFQDKSVVSVPDEEGRADGDVFICQDDDYITVYGDVLNIDWKMAFGVDRSRLLNELNPITLVLLGILCLVVLITLLFSRRLFSIITDNFKRLVDGMEKVKQGNLNIRVERKQDDEVGILVEEFNGMVKNLNILMDEVEKKQILLKQAEVKALQQQINPHFIFNILETIMGLASEGLGGKVITVCQGMSSMLRYNISFQNKTSLQNEIEQMKNYIRIMEIRFENRFEVFYDIDPDCLPAEFVKFTLQPLVENSVSHGLSQCSSGGLIRIRVQKQEEQIAISIYDNGCGIKKKELDDINRKINETIENPLDYVDQYSGLGLMNTNLRLRMHFREKYHIEIFSKEGHGTCIYIKIPFVKM